MECGDSMLHGLENGDESLHSTNTRGLQSLQRFYLNKERE